MKHIGKVGPMYLLQVVSVIRNISRGSDITYYHINFGDCKLAVTALHAFVAVDGQAKLTTELKRSDLIWIDTSAFMADGSFTSNSSGKIERNFP
jgi:hypothetical protein